jgi:hypothetical protein
VGAISFTPAELAASITKVLPHFTCEYAPDFRQAIADTWPQALDDSMARRDWGWNPDYDLDAMTVHMLEQLSPVADASRAEALKEGVREAAEKRRDMLDFLATGPTDEPVRV